MLGKPKYKCGDVVSFVAWTPLVDLPFGGQLDESNAEKVKLIGIIQIVDQYGTLDDSTDVSYDIYVESQNCLYKHITEKEIIFHTCPPD